MAKYHGRHRLEDLQPGGADEVYAEELTAMNADNTATEEFPAISGTIEVE